MASNDNEENDEENNEINEINDNNNNTNDELAEIPDIEIQTDNNKNMESNDNEENNEIDENNDNDNDNNHNNTNDAQLEDLEDECIEIQTDVKEDDNVLIQHENEYEEYKQEIIITNDKNIEQIESISNADPDSFDNNNRTRPPQQEEEKYVFIKESKTKPSTYNNNEQQENEEEEEKYGANQDEQINNNKNNKNNKLHINNDSVYMKSELEEYCVNYWYIIFVTLLTTSTGLVIYIFTDLWWIILMFASLGLLPSSITEYYSYYKTQETNMKVEINDNKQNKENKQINFELEEERLVEWEEKNEDDIFYVETHFDNSYIETISDGKKGKHKSKRNVNVTGITRVYHKKGSGILMIEKRAAYTFQDYKGYEIGGGLSSLTGFSITIIVQIIKIIIGTVSDNEVDWALNVFILLFITFALLCFGCIIEIELRKKNVLPPNKKLFLTATSIALHEIKSLDRHSTTNYQNVSSDLDEQGGTSLTMQKIAIKWFQCLLGIYKLIKWIFVALYINTAVVMLVSVFIVLGLLFDLSINKSNAMLSNQIVIIIVYIWISVGIGLFGIYYTSQGYCQCNKSYKRLSTQNRIELSKQQCIWSLLLIVTILLFIAAVMITSVRTDIYTNDANDKMHSSLKVWNQMHCIASISTSNPSSISNSNSSSNSSTNSSSNLTANLTANLNANLSANLSANSSANSSVNLNSSFIVPTAGYYENEPFCIDQREITINFSLYFVWISWYLLLITSYLWKKYDRVIFQFDIKKNAKMKRVWKRYSVINIGLKTQKKSSHFSLFGGSNQSVINIELDPNQAIKLHSYLNTVVPWFKMHTFLPQETGSNSHPAMQPIINSNNDHNPIVNLVFSVFGFAVLLLFFFGFLK